MTVLDEYLPIVYIQCDNCYKSYLDGVGIKSNKYLLHLYISKQCDCRVPKIKCLFTDACSVTFTNIYEKRFVACSFAKFIMVDINKLTCPVNIDLSLTIVLECKNNGLYKNVVVGNKIDIEPSSNYKNNNITKVPELSKVEKHNVCIKTDHNSNNINVISNDKGHISQYNLNSNYSSSNENSDSEDVYEYDEEYKTEYKDVSDNNNIDDTIEDDSEDGDEIDDDDELEFDNYSCDLINANEDDIIIEEGYIEPTLDLTTLDELLKTDNVDNTTINYKKCGINVFFYKLSF